MNNATTVKSDETHRMVCRPNGIHRQYRVEFANGVTTEWTNYPTALIHFNQG